MKNKIQIKVNDLSDYLEYDYDIKRDCANNDCEQICRCSEITNIDIQKSRLDASAFEFQIKNPETNRNLKYKISDIEIYCIERLIIFNDGLDIDKFEINTSSGFYGEEIVGASFGNIHHLTSDVFEMINMDSDIKKVLFILEKEYGYLADIVKDCENAEIVIKRPCEIRPSGGNSVKKQDDYIQPFDVGETIGVIKDNLLIDGNHRLGYAYSKNMENENFQYISIS